MSPDTVIVKERHDVLVLQEGGDVYTIPRSEYHILRIRHYKCNRIFYSFGLRDAVIKETYNEGIFNCWLGQRHVQIADAEGIARVIVSGDIEAYAEIFAEWYEAVMQQEVIDGVVAQFPGRVRHTPEGYEVDDMFRVDPHGAAQYRDGGHWRGLCIVAGAGGKRSIDAPGIGDVWINVVTMTIIAKVMFLLHPNAADGVFMNQLSKECRKHVMHLAGGTHAR